MTSPVRCSDASEARKVTTLLTSPGDTQGTGNTLTATLGGVGLLRVLPGRVFEVRQEQPSRHLVIDHRRLHVAGVDAVDADQFEPDLLGEGARECDHGRLGRVVVADPGRRHEGGARGGDDYRSAAAARPDVGYGGFEGVPCAGEVDVDHVLPGAFVEVEYRTHGED